MLGVLVKLWEFPPHFPRGRTPLSGGLTGADAPRTPSGHTPAFDEPGDIAFFVARLRAWCAMALALRSNLPRHWHASVPAES
jgi:hypothetical protein